MITMTVYHEDGREEVVETDLRQLREVMAPYFPNAYTDMFVDEDGLSKNLPRNNWLTQHPEMMAFIVDRVRY